MNWPDRISVNLKVRHGKACIRSTRVMISVGLDNLVSGESAEGTMRGYHLDREDIEAAMRGIVSDFTRTGGVK